MRRRLNPDQLPLFEPPTDWERLPHLPEFPTGSILAIDTETRDPHLTTRGPGWVFGNGHIAGFSCAWDNVSFYAPLRHPDTDNFEIDEAMRWLQDAIDRAGRIVFHSQPYDQGWLSTDGVTIPDGKTDDVQFMAVIIDENRLAYGLDALCRAYNIPGKDERLLREAAATYGLDPKKDMWRLPARHVGPYAAQDAVSTLGLREAMYPEIEKQNLRDAYKLEMDLIPMIMAMRRRGIRIDETGAEKVQTRLRAQRDAAMADVSRRVGGRQLTIEDFNSPVSLERMFDEQQIPYTRTPKTNRGSFTSDWMKEADHWLPRAVVQIRQTHDMSEKFIGTYLLGATHVGRVHAEIHQLRDDTGGTRSYRFSYSNPPLQQIPGRDPVLSPLIRGIMLPEKGQLWVAADYSQQEPRLAVHFASVCRREGAAEAVRYYHENKNADFHTMVSELTGVARKLAKIINLGLMYGMGIHKLAASLGLSLEDAKAVVAQYNDKMPFVRSLSEFCTNRASNRGFIRLLDGARCRFDDYEPAWRGSEDHYQPPCRRDEALRRLQDPENSWEGRIKRAWTHKAMNRLIQGSAARQTKIAMLGCWREGILPMLQMHDELAITSDEEREVRRVVDIMVHAVELVVPMRVDVQFGHNWGQASDEAPDSTEPPTFDEVRRLGGSNQVIYDAR